MQFGCSVKLWSMSVVQQKPSRKKDRLSSHGWDSATCGHFVHDWDDYSEECDHPDGDDEEYGIYVEEDPALEMEGHSESDMGD